MNESVEPNRNPATWRARAFTSGRQILEGYARKQKGRSAEQPTDEPWSVQRPADVLEDIEDAYHYEPWDVALIGALAALLHPRTRVPQALRAEAARITAERRRVLTALRQFRKKFMSGSQPVVSCIQMVLAPRPGVGQIYTSGRPHEWVLDEFAGCMLVILGRARIRNVAEPPLEPIGVAFDYGRELLRSVGIEVPRHSLDERVRALPDLPPEPTDDDPLGWAENIARRLYRVPEGGAILRRVFVPAADLPLETFRYRMLASSPDIFVRRFTRKALPKTP